MLFRLEFIILLIIGFFTVLFLPNSNLNSLLSVFIDNFSVHFAILSFRVFYLFSLIVFRDPSQVYPHFYCFLLQLSQHCLPCPQNSSLVNLALSSITSNIEQHGLDMLDTQSELED